MKENLKYWLFQNTSSGMERSLPERASPDLRVSYSLENLAAITYIQFMQSFILSSILKVVQEYQAPMPETRVSEKNWAPRQTSSLLVAAEGLKEGFLCRAADCHGGLDVFIQLLYTHIPMS